MEYDHAEKAGNRGDVWKHAILTAVVQHATGDRQHRLRYAETHAGAGVYQLAPGGSWMQGVGVFRKCSPSPSPLLAALLPPDPERYFGSWMLVRRLLEGVQQPYEMDLWELDPEVVAKAMEYQSASTAIRLGDGFSGVREKQYDLVLIDPPYTGLSDWSYAHDLATELQSRRVPFLLWYTVEKTRRADYLTTSLDSPYYELRWRDGGCGVIVSGAVTPSPLELANLAETLEGCLL